MIPLNREAREFAPHHHLENPGSVPSGNKELLTSPRITDSVEPDAIVRLADILDRTFKKHDLPPIEPQVFKGDIYSYPLWINNFETYVEHKIDSHTERLHYLSKYTDGEAKTAIMGFFTLKTEDAYYRAKQRIDEHYGNEFVVAKEYKKRIREWPVIKPNDGIALRNFVDFLEHCMAAMKTICHLKVLDDPEENEKMLEKLPRDIVNSWANIVDKWLHGYEGDRDDDWGNITVGQYPPFSRFIKFLYRHARIACGPVKQMDQYRIQHNRSRPSAISFATDSEVSHKIGPGQNLEERKKVCVQCSVDHSVENCDSLKKMSLNDRLVLVRKCGLCSGCLKRGHM